MTTYTVFALYADNFQRFCETVEAPTPDEAESIIRANAEGELLIAGVIEGRHVCVDTAKIYGYQ